MSARSFKSGRRMRSEMVPLASVALIAFAAFCLFPREALFFARNAGTAPAKSPRAEACCAFVTLSPAQEKAARAAARTSWQGVRRTNGQEIEMLPKDLPETAHAPILDLGARPSEKLRFYASPRVSVLPPSGAAAAPVQLKATVTEARKMAFPREQLLKLH